MDSKQLPLQTAAGALAAVTLVSALPHHPHPVADLRAPLLQPPATRHFDEIPEHLPERSLPALTVKEVRPIATPFDNEAMFPPPQDWPWMPQIRSSMTPLTLMMASGGMGWQQDELPLQAAEATAEFALTDRADA